MNVELMEHLELRGEEKHSIVFTFDINKHCLRGLNEQQKEFLHFYLQSEFLRWSEEIQRKANIYLYKLRHPNDFK